MMGVLCCRNLSRIFFLNSLSLLLWVMRVYIVWVKSKKVTLKIFQVKSSAGTSRDGLSHKVLAKYSLVLNSSASSMCFSCALFEETLLANFLQASHETTLIFISCSILHQLNTKLNTIKSHKIQGNNLIHLQHFLSWNKANIKYSCKSQLYRNSKVPVYFSFLINQSK